MESYHPSDNTYLLPKAVSEKPMYKPSAKATFVTDEVLHAYRKGFSNMQEMDYYVDDNMIEGDLPEEIQGTFLQNGPGIFAVNGRVVTNPIDGDGVICSLAFRGRKIFFRSRYVRTPGLSKVHKSAYDRPVKLGTSWPKDLLDFKLAIKNPLDLAPNNLLNFSSKNPANQGVLCLGRRVYALHEAGLPFHLDGTTLSTVGQTDFDGALDAALAGNYKVVKGHDGSERHVVFGIAPRGVDAVASIYELDQNKVVQTKRVHLPRAAGGFIQDIAVTDNFYILIESPTAIDLEKVVTQHLVGSASASECLYLDDSRTTKIHVIPRKQGESQILTLRTAAMMAQKHINAYEIDGGERIVLDTCLWKEFDFTSNPATMTALSLAEGPAPVIGRLSLDLVSGEVSGTVLSCRAPSSSCVHPDLVGKPHAVSFLATSRVDSCAGPPQVLMRLTADPCSTSTSTSVNTTTWEPGPTSFLGELVMVPKKGAAPPGEGWLICTIFDSNTSTSKLAVIDSENIGRGPVATINFPHHLPYGLQSVFVPGTYLGPAKIAPKDWTPDIIPIPPQ